MARPRFGKGTLETTSIRLDEALRSRIRALSEAMSERLGGVPVTTSMVTRAALGRGLDALEIEFGIAKKGKR